METCCLQLFDPLGEDGLGHRIHGKSRVMLGYQLTDPCFFYEITLGGYRRKGQRSIRMYWTIWLADSEEKREENWRGDYLL